MLNQFLYRTEASVIALMVFAGMLIFAWLGGKAGQWLNRKVPEEKGIIGALDISLLGLLSFMLAFTFGMSGNRYEAHRQIIVKEANSIGTAVLRADLYSDQNRKVFRDDFRKYLESRIAYYKAGMDEEAMSSAKLISNKIGERLWNRAMRLSKDPDMFLPSMQMIPALNDMFDAATTRDISLRSRVPFPVVYMLFILAFTIAFMTGFGEGLSKKGFLLFTGFALLIAMIIYVTLDLDRPREGVINASLGQTAIVQLRKMF